MPNYPAIDFDYHSSLPNRDTLTPIMVYVNADIIKSVAGLLLSICATKPSDEHIDDMQDANIRNTDEDVRMQYTSVALDLLARRPPMATHDDIVTILQEGSKDFTSSYDETNHRWTITLTLPSEAFGDCNVVDLQDEIEDECCCD